MIHLKDGRVESPVVLGWVRRQRCRVGEEMEAKGERVFCVGPIDPHHVEGKGMGGARCRDDRVVPLCRRHHEGAHEHVGDAAAHVGPWALETLCRFLEQATSEEVRQYMRDLERWKERPLAVAW